MKNLRSGGAVFGMALIVASVGAVFGEGCSRHTSAGAAVEVKSDEDKALYGLGLLLGRNVGTFNLTPHELELVQKGLADYVLKPKAFGDLNAYSTQVDALAHKRADQNTAREKAKSKDFLAAAEKEAGAVKAPEGFVIKSTRAGTGPQPSMTDHVKVHYEGRLIDGTVFDSSIKRGEPAVFQLDGVIKCWTAGLARMKVGEKATLTCPSDVAYGDSGRPPTIPGGATLVFDVELLSIEAAAPTPLQGSTPLMPAVSPHGMPSGAHGMPSRPPQASR